MALSRKLRNAANEEMKLKVVFSPFLHESTVRNPSNNRSGPDFSQKHKFLSRPG